ncbi:MAG: hypothetical protein ACLFR1_15845, partial [Spirochaetia bacterium]
NSDNRISAEVELQLNEKAEPGYCYLRKTREAHSEIQFFTQLANKKIDLVLMFFGFSGIHGMFQGICELYGIPFAGPGIRSSILTAVPELCRIYAVGRGLRVRNSPAASRKHEDVWRFLVYRGKSGSGVKLLSGTGEVGTDCMYEMQEAARSGFAYFGLTGIAEIVIHKSGNSIYFSDIHSFPDIYPGSMVYEKLIEDGWSSPQIVRFVIDSALSAFESAELQKQKWTVY